MYQWAPGSVESVLLGGEPNALLVGPPAKMDAITSEYAPPTSGDRLASWMFVRMRQRGYSDDVIHAFLAAEGLPREPTTVSAVRRIADATGATVAEVLALLGVEDMSARRALQTVAPDGSGDDAAGTAPGHEGALNSITASERAPCRAEET
jgi:hypothetical protein